MKSDPLQGILFKTKPLYLQEKAAKRAQLTVEKQNPSVFFDKIGGIKTGTERLARWKKTAMSNIAVRYEHSPIGPKSKRHI